MIITQVHPNTELSYQLHLLTHNHCEDISLISKKIIQIEQSVNKCVDYLHRNGLLLVKNLEEDCIDKEFFDPMQKSLELFNSFKELYLGTLAQVENELKKNISKINNKTEISLAEFDNINAIFKLINSLVPPMITPDNIKTNYDHYQMKDLDGVLEKKKKEFENINLANKNDDIFQKIRIVNKIAEHALTKSLNVNQEEKHVWLELFTNACMVSIYANKVINQSLIHLATSLKNQSSEPKKDEIAKIQEYTKLFLAYFIA